jgi:glycosyltransferase involved in cell wall biosynthesis
LINVVFDHQVFTDQRHGGISRYFAETVYHLKQIPDIYPRFGFLFSRNEHVTNLARGEVFSYRRGHRLVSCINDIAARSRTAQAEIVHTTYYHSEELQKIQGKRHIATVYDMIPELFPQFFADGNPHFNKLEYCREADFIICISEQTRRDLLSVYGIPANKTATIHLGVSPNRPCDSETARLIDAPYLLFVGNRTLYKNFLTLLSAFTIVQERHRGLLLVCAGGGPFTSSEWQRIVDLGGTKTVRQLNVTDAQLCGLFAEARGFVFPSLYEGFGLPILDAFVVGCPTALSDIGAFREIAGDAALYFDPSDPESCACAIEHLLDDSFTKTRITRGTETARQLTWELTARRHADIYRKVT